MVFINERNARADVSMEAIVHGPVFPARSEAT
jgi:hypothetical protein